MKIFQIVNNICYYDATPVHPTLKSTEGKYPPDVLFVEAPDKVHEGWGYDATQVGDARFIQPTPPAGWQYDEDTGTFYQGELYSPHKQRKIDEMNYACSMAITNGCDVELTDGTTEHFALTAEDQINIATAEKAVQKSADHSLKKSSHYITRDYSLQMSRVYSGQRLICPFPQVW